VSDDTANENGNGDSGAGPNLPRTERYEAPLYLARYLERQARRRGGGGDAAPAGDDNTPLYLRRFRERRLVPSALDAPPPEAGGFSAKYAEVARSKEIVAPPEARIPLRASVRLVRHGETQGYSTDSGLTPLGGWQSHRRGFDISKGVRDGDVVRLVVRRHRPGPPDRRPHPPWPARRPRAVGPDGGDRRSRGPARAWPTSRWPRPREFATSPLPSGSTSR
jgi:hypothetical protein